MPSKKNVNVSAVFFDMDGVLIDSIHAWHTVVNQALRQLNYPLVHFEGFERDFGQGTAADSQQYTNGQVSPVYLESLYNQLIAQYTHLIKVNPQATSILLWLKRQKIKTACVTNSNRAVATRNLTRLGLREKLNLLVTGDDALRHKPYPDMIDLALGKLSLKPQEVLFVGDSIFDQQAAMAAGVSFVAYQKPLKGATRVIGQLGDIKKLFFKRS